MVSDLKEDINKQMPEVKKYFWDLENEVQVALISWK